MICPSLWVVRHSVAPMSMEVSSSDQVMSLSATNRYIGLLPPAEGVYHSYDELSQAVQSRARNQGYKTVIKSSSNRNATIRCKLSGKPRVSEGPRHPTHPRIRPSRRLDCPFNLYAKRVFKPKRDRNADEPPEVQNEEWELFVRDSSHNHPATNHHVGRALDQDQIDKINELISRPPGGSLKLDPFWIIVPIPPTEISPVRSPTKRPNFAENHQKSDLSSSLERYGAQRIPPAETAQTRPPVTHLNHTTEHRQNDFSTLLKGDGVQKIPPLETDLTRPSITNLNHAGNHEQNNLSSFLKDGGVQNIPMTKTTPIRPPFTRPNHTGNHSQSDLSTSGGDTAQTILLMETAPLRLPVTYPNHPPNHPETPKRCDLTSMGKERLEHIPPTETASIKQAATRPSHAENGKQSDPSSSLEGDRVGKVPPAEIGPIRPPITRPNHAEKRKLNDLSSSLEGDGLPKRRKKEPTCSNCGTMGHTYRSCPTRG